MEICSSQDAGCLSQSLGPFQWSDNVTIKPKKDPQVDEWMLSISWLAPFSTFHLNQHLNRDPGIAELRPHRTSWSFRSRVGSLGRQRLNQRLGLNLKEAWHGPPIFVVAFQDGPIWWFDPVPTPGVCTVV